jgi:hypothetical protein
MSIMNLDGTWMEPAAIRALHWVTRTDHAAPCPVPSDTPVYVRLEYDFRDPYDEREADRAIRASRAAFWTYWTKGSEAFVAAYTVHPSWPGYDAWLVQNNAPAPEPVVSPRVAVWKERMKMLTEMRAESFRWINENADMATSIKAEGYRDFQRSSAVEMHLLDGMIQRETKPAASESGPRKNRRNIDL